MKWSFEPAVVIPLVMLLVIFAVGRVRLQRRSNVQRPGTSLFLAGWLVLAVALISPLHEAGEQSFTMHMIEHELIMLVATLLLVESGAGGILAWGLPRPLRRALAGGWTSPLQRLWMHVTEPLTATIIQAIVLWVWHAPALFNLALGSDWWHAAQHLSFVLASVVFWSAMLNARRGNYLLSAACLFLTSLVEGALGALMTFSAGPWYAAYAAMGVTGIGVDPATDQQLAGLVMWVPGGLLHAGAAVFLLHRWLKGAEDGHAVRVH